MDDKRVLMVLAGVRDALIIVTLLVVIGLSAYAWGRIDGLTDGLF